MPWLRLPVLRRRRGLLAFVAILYALFAVVRLADHRFDVTRFITAGDRFYTEAALVHPVYVERQSDGYDGQFFYRLALDPWTHRRTEYGIIIDNPVVRAQRIGYPLAAWAVSVGQPAAIPYALVLLNLAAVVGIGAIGLGFAGHFGVARRWGLLLAFYPGFVLSLARDTAEIAATFLALAALFAATRGRYVPAAMLACAAVLTRESTLLYLAGFGVVALWRAGTVARHWPRIACCAAPLVVYLAWQHYLALRWGSYSISDLGPHDLSLVPVRDYLRWVGHYLAAASSAPIRYHILFECWSILAVAAMVAFVAISMVRHRCWRLDYVVPWVGYLLLASIFTGAIWNEAYGFLRILSDLYALSIVILLACRDERRLRALTPLVGVTWLGAVAYCL